MRHYVLVRSAYGPSWSLEANRRRLDISRAVTIRSLASQTTSFRLLVLLHRSDPLLAERMAAFGAIGADFLYHDGTGTSAEVAFSAYRAGWAEAIGPRDETVAMTRLDDDDALAPWVVEKVQEEARKATRRTALMLPAGIRVWRGGYTIVFHRSNAMHTLVTPPGDEMTVYDYPHRFVAKHARVKAIDGRIAWIWSRHEDTISGWHVSDLPLTDKIREMFPIDWSLFDGPHKRPTPGARRGRCFR